MSNKKVLYARCSTQFQNPDRQIVDKDSYDESLVDFCSGTIPIFERPQGKILKRFIDEGVINEIHIHSIDRCARNLSSLLNFIEYCHKHNVCLFIKNLGMKSLNENGKTNYAIKMMISIMGSFAEIENEIRKERQLEGIAIAKLKGKYKNRKTRGRESTQQFLSKHAKVIEYLEKGLKGSEIIRLMDGGISANTITKIKRYLKVR